MTTNWHTAKMESMKSKSIESLYYIIKDCNEAAACAESMGDYERAGRYTDEMHYAVMELANRQKPLTTRAA